MSQKPSALATDFSVVLTIQDKQCPAFQAHLLRGYTKAIITAHEPGQHAWPSPDPWPDSKGSKTMEVWYSF